MSVQTSSTEDRPDRRHHQLQTAKAASRFEQRWTSYEDLLLLTGDGTVAQRAKRLGRTYYAAEARLAKLRRNLAQVNAA